MKNEPRRRGAVAQPGKPGDTMATRNASRLRHIAHSLTGSEQTSEATAEPSSPPSPSPERAANPLLPPRYVSPATDVADGMPDTLVPTLTPNDVAVRRREPRPFFYLLIY